MGHHAELERKNEMLKKNVSKMILKENQQGLDKQEHLLKDRFIKEMHSNTQSINATK